MKGIDFQKIVDIIDHIAKERKQQIKEQEKAR
jgi:hypothetical protein